MSRSFHCYALFYALLLTKFITAMTSKSCISTYKAFHDIISSVGVTAHRLRYFAEDVSTHFGTMLDPVLLEIS